MALKYNYTMSLADVELGAKSLNKRAAAVRQDLHKLSVSTLYQWHKTGDVTVPCRVAAVILNNCDPYHAQGVVNWMKVYAGFEYQKDSKSFTYTKTTISYDEVEESMDEPFWQLSPPKEVQAFDLEAKIMALIATAEKRTKHLKEGDNVPSVLLAAIKQAVVQSAA